jgi:hypothetical protein
MFSFIKNISFYSFGQILNKSIQFLLLPLYAHYLLPEDYGKLELTYLYGAVLVIFYGFIIENKTGSIAHTRWICLKEFYSDPLKENLVFSEKEVLTLDSYTHPDHRFKGLHKEMNIRMLNYLKNKTDIEIVYIIIRWFYPYLHKVVKDLGYKRIKTKIYYKKGSINNVFSKSFQKLTKRS